MRSDADVVAIPIDSPATLQERLRSTPADVVFNLCESLRGDPRYEIPVPVILESQGVAYTGNGPLALRVALDKSTARDTLHETGVPVPEGRLVTCLADLTKLGDFPLPAIVKPGREDGSIGIEAGSVVATPTALKRRARYVLTQLKQAALVERYVDGREFNVSVLGNEPPVTMPLAEIDFSGMPAGAPRIVSYRAKWHNRTAEYRGTTPRFAAVDEALGRRIRKAALAAFRALGLRDYARVDIRVDAEHRPYVIDVNPNCDLAPDAGFAKAAKAAGVEYPELVERLLGMALERGKKRHATASDPNRRPIVPA